MKKIPIAILALAVLATSVIFAVGQKATGGEHRGFGRRGHYRGMGMTLRGLNLREDQKAKLKELRAASRGDLKPTLQALKANRRKMNELTANGAFDEAQVTALANERAALSAKLIVERQRMKLQLFSLLSEEQKAKLAEIKAKRAEGRKARRAARAEKVGE